MNRFMGIFSLILALNFIWALDIGSNNMIAGLFFVESITEFEVRQAYTQAQIGRDKVSVLVVPGHNSRYKGTYYRGTHEVELTRILATKIYERLSEDPKFAAYITQVDGEYTHTFSNYFERERESIIAFRNYHKRTMEKLVNADLIDAEFDSNHNFAPSDTYVELYGINKWANENDIDLVLHVHFNDHPRSDTNIPGKYSGFAIFIPDNQFSNAKVSRVVGNELKNQLLTLFPTSNLFQEQGGLVEDQEFIALGSYNTLDSASFLIEYDYIFEPHISAIDLRAATLDEYAFQTYRGLQRYFEYFFLDDSCVENTNILPHEWNQNIEIGEKGSVDVLALQAALMCDGVYPPNGKDRNSCSFSGIFGTCTKGGVESFQEKYSILPVNGIVDAKTRAVLNALYGN